jgi:hypothetical protein
MSTPRGRQVVAQAGGEFGRRELQAQGQQQQHDADGRACRDELAAGGQRQDPALTQRQTRKQVHRDRGQRESACDAAHYGQRGQEGAEL